MKFLQTLEGKDGAWLCVGVLGLAAVVHGIFGAGSSIRGGGGGGGLNCGFQGFFASIGEIFILAGGLGTGLSFYGVWALS